MNCPYVLFLNTGAQQIRAHIRAMRIMTGEAIRSLDRVRRSSTFGMTAGTHLNRIHAKLPGNAFGTSRPFRDMAGHTPLDIRLFGSHRAMQISALKQILMTAIRNAICSSCRQSIEYNNQYRPTGQPQHS